MSSTPAESESLLSPRKMLIQIVGWLIGIGLLFWVVKGAAAKGDWSRITNADPWLVAALVGCTAASAVFNGTAFEILSIDIADVDVGENIGANLQAHQAEADKKRFQAEAEKRRAMAVAQEAEFVAEAQKNRAQVILAEAEVPKAMADAFRKGYLGIMDYYRMKNVVADTAMRDAIAGGNSSDSKS